MSPVNTQNFPMPSTARRALRVVLLILIAWMLARNVPLAIRTEGAHGTGVIVMMLVPAVFLIRMFVQEARFAGERALEGEMYRDNMMRQADLPEMGGIEPMCDVEPAQVEASSESVRYDPNLNGEAKRPVPDMPRAAATGRSAHEESAAALLLRGSDANG